ncbi:MAG TPA: hypothetical protein VGB91_12415 [Rhizomicrobium sp.]
MIGPLLFAAILIVLGAVVRAWLLRQGFAGRLYTALALLGIAMTSMAMRCTAPAGARSISC